MCELLNLNTRFLENQCVHFLIVNLMNDNNSMSHITLTTTKKYLKVIKFIQISKIYTPLKQYFLFLSLRFAFTQTNLYRELFIELNVNFRKKTVVHMPTSRFY